MSRLTTTLLASALMVPSFAFAQDNADEDLIIVTGSPLSTNLDEAITGPVSYTHLEPTRPY